MVYLLYALLRLNVNYWLVNGVQPNEDFNGNKSQAVLLTLKPARALSWNVNDCTGIEDQDTVAALNPGIPVLPTQPGLSTIPLVGLRSRLYILESYASLNVNPNLTLAIEDDDVKHPIGTTAAHVSTAAAYARYLFTRNFALAGRGEYFNDRGGLFSGTTQALKETTLTAGYLFAEGFLMRTEWRRDFSNRPFFLTDSADVLKREQNTATLGLVWWFDRKQGAW